MKVTKKKQDAPNLSYGGPTVKKANRFMTFSRIKRGIAFSMLLFPLFTQEAKAVEIEARTGVSYAYSWGLHAGAYVNFPQSKLFSIQTGYSFSLSGKKN